MAQTINKPRLVNHLLTTLKNRYGDKAPEERPVLEQLVYAICREGTTREKADRAYGNLVDRFFDWNEIRVSSPHEVQDALAELPNAESRALRIVSVLQEVFETTFSFDLEPLQKKGWKLASKQLARYQAASGFAIAWVGQHTLGGQTIPVDAPSLRLMRRMGLADDTDDQDSVFTVLDPVVPKTRLSLFSDMLSGVADEFCFEDEPDCPHCPLNSECPTAQEHGGAKAARTGRNKPR